MNVAKRAIEMVHDKDPRETIMEKIGDVLPAIHVMPYDLIVAIYQRPERTKGNILLPDKTRDEENWQGKIGLVVKVGELAFNEDDEHQWGSRKPKLGDWVVFRVGDTFPFLVKELTCRHISERNIRMIVDRPDIIM